MYEFDEVKCSLVEILLNYEEDVKVKHIADKLSTLCHKRGLIGKMYHFSSRHVLDMLSSMGIHKTPTRTDGNVHVRVFADRVKKWAVAYGIETPDPPTTFDELLKRQVSPSAVATYAAAVKREAYEKKRKKILRSKTTISPDDIKVLTAEETAIHIGKLAPVERVISIRELIKALTSEKSEEKLKSTVEETLELICMNTIETHWVVNAIAEKLGLSVDSIINAECSPPEK